MLLCSSIILFFTFCPYLEETSIDRLGKREGPIVVSQRLDRDGIGLYKILRDREM